MKKLSKCFQVRNVFSFSDNLAFQSNQATDAYQLQNDRTLKIVYPLSLSSYLLSFILRSATKGWSKRNDNYPWVKIIKTFNLIR